MGDWVTIQVFYPRINEYPVPFKGTVRTPSIMPGCGQREPKFILFLVSPVARFPLAKAF